ncbi:MAG: MFS transporter [Actinomycetota bacterium]|nr:MFS transporter [Actinomycetota bacterium]
MPKPGLLADRDFRRYWIGNATSSLGTSVTLVALPLVALVELDATSSQVGLVRAAEFLPFFLLTLPVGLLADRSRRRPLMIAADVGRALVLAALPVAAALGMLSLPLVIGVALALGSLTVVFDVCYLSVLPGLVGRERVEEGNRLLELAHAGARTAGPAIGAALVAVVRPVWALLVDAASYVVSAVSLWTLAPEAPPECRRDERARDALRAGLVQVRRSSYVRPLTLYLGVNNLATQAFNTAVVVFVVRSLALSPAVVGVAFAASSVGFFAGAATSSAAARRWGPGPLICLASVVGAAGFALVAAAGPLPPVPTVGAGMAVSGFATGLFNLQSVTLRQTVTPDEVLGRVNSVVRLASYSGFALGAWLGGAVIGPLSPRATLVAAAIVSLLATAFPLLSPVVRVRGRPAPEPVFAQKPAPSS